MDAATCTTYMQSTMPSNTWNTISTKKWSDAVQYYYASPPWILVVKQTVIVIAAAGTEALHRQGDQTWTFIAFVDGADSDAAPESDLRVIFFLHAASSSSSLRRGRRRSCTGEGTRPGPSLPLLMEQTAIQLQNLTEKQDFGVAGSAGVTILRNSMVRK